MVNVSMMSENFGGLGVWVLELKTSANWGANLSCDSKYQMLLSAFASPL